MCKRIGEMRTNVRKSSTVQHSTARASVRQFKRSIHYSIMKKLLSMGLVALATAGFCFNSQAQDPIAAGISNIVGQIDESTNLFATGEIEVRLGGVYVQAQDKAATLIAAEYWGLIKSQPNLGFGAELISLSTETAAVFPYVAYRKVLGNTSGCVFVGGGYDYDADSGFGVAGLRLEHRTSKHVGIWASVSYEIQGKGGDRGIIFGAGISYAF